MDEKRAFLRGIAEAGEDDTPRLAYADWIQEQGDEKLAVLIRRSIAYPGSIKVANRPASSYRWQMRGFSGGQHPFAGCVELARQLIPPPPKEVHWCSVVVHRGFPCDFSVPLEWWGKHAEKILADVPRPTVRLFVGDHQPLSHRMVFASINNDTQFRVSFCGQTVTIDKTPEGRLNYRVSYLDPLRVLWPDADFKELE